MHPILIAGVALVGLPIVLHFLLKQEPKKLFFPALRFLRQKQKTSERKMRLKHFLLLLLRCLLIALFALTLYQPNLLTSGTFNLSGEQPVAAVLILDTSPSMGYTVVGESRLDEARKRALEFLGTLPENSKVAVVDLNDVIANWEPTLFEARNRLNALKEPAGSTPPLTAGLVQAYQLLKTADADLPEGSDPLPRVVAVFSDRTANSWDTGRVEELKAMRATVPNPAPLHLFFDVGVTNPVNFSILGVQMKPQLISGSADAAMTVTLRSMGVPETEEVKLQAILDNGAQQERFVKLAPGTAQAERFTFPSPGLGFHSVVFRILREDALPFDSERSFTFRVAPNRKILTIADNREIADAWDLAHIGKQEFDNTVVLAEPVPDLAGFEAITLLGVKEPSPALAARLRGYVKAGGKLLLIPDGPDAGPERAAIYNKAFADILPAPLGDLTTWEVPNADARRKYGVTWKLDDDVDFKHPLLTPLKAWKQQGNIDLFNPTTRRVAVTYRKLAGAIPTDTTIVARFDDADTDADRAPALLERTFDRGTVLMLTTRFDFDASSERRFWNDYAKTDNTWLTVLPWLLMRHLVGSPDDAEFNFAAGADVFVPLPQNLPRKLRYQGPGVLPADAELQLGEKPSELRLSGTRTLNAGEFVLQSGVEPDAWQFRFSLNTPVAESTLDKVPEESINDLFGPNSVAAVDRKVELRDLIEQRFDKRLELFPLLLLLVLAFFVLEGLAANRFYKSR